MIGLDLSIIDDLNRSIALVRLQPRPIGPGELARLRVIWWNLTALRYRLPPERDVIVIEGGAS